MTEYHELTPNEILQVRDMIRTHADLERRVSNQTYSIKLVEHIVFSLVGLMAISIVGALISLVITR